MKPDIVVIGVLRSCDTLARKVRRISSRFASDAAMLLNPVASSATSSRPLTGTRTSNLPEAKLFAARDISLRGVIILSEIMYTEISAASMTHRLAMMIVFIIETIS